MKYLHPPLVVLWHGKGSFAVPFLIPLLSYKFKQKNIRETPNIYQKLLIQYYLKDNTCHHAMSLLPFAFSFYQLNQFL